jgi:hypothetical protein
VPQLDAGLHRGAEASVGVLTLAGTAAADASLIAAPSSPSGVEGGVSP